jgi:acyl-CoA synthetase (AMP-forming)/AMP-acid ligase II/NAD(P)-dependent dehydrogenase (short-subunit alcohol dehydrogenase family)
MPDADTNQTRAATVLRAAMRAVSPLVNPRNPPTEAELRAAVAGRVVLITGASYGLGEATARKLAAAGAEVVLVARSRDRLDEVAAAIATRGGVAHVHAADLTDDAAVEALAREVLARHGHVDVLVNNAGKSIRRSIAGSAQRFGDFERTMRVNYLGPVRLALALLPSMRARRRGHIVNISTIGARLPPAPRWAAYQASKGAFDTWLRSAAPEIRGDGVATTSIYMALIYTRMSAPTPIFRTLPGLEPDQAADIVCRAIVDRPSLIEPWWLGPAALTTLLPRPTLEAALGAVYRVTERITERGAPSTVGLVRQAASALLRSGVLAPVRPDRAMRMAIAAARTGATPAAACAISAARFPDQLAIADDLGTLTYRELDRRVTALAAALHGELGVGPDRPLAIMCRNHRGFVVALLAGSRLGADVLLLNTEFPGPQLGDALAGHAIGAVVLDDDFTAVFDAAGYAGPRVTSLDGIDALVARGGPRPPRPRRQSRFTILTSGTTGRPKGAPRTPSLRAVLGPTTTLLATIGLRAREPILIGPPLFHGFGLSYLALGLFLGATLVLRRRFEPEAALETIARHRVTSLVAVPVMLRRILDLPADVRARHDTSALRAAISAGAQLPGDLACAFMDAFGDVVYNLYGSTETGFGALAGPADLRAAPGTVGRPPSGTTIGILDDRGARLPAGQVGRIFVGSPLAFEGYSGGGSKEVIGGLMSTGDLGHLDGDGRLFIDGRADDMIVSGGENVFPQEVEDVMSRHAAVAEVAVVGVPDPEFGQRLRAFVVARAGAAASADELKAYVKTQVARYKVPRDIVFLDELPRNPVGKVVRSRLTVP